MSWKLSETPNWPSTREPWAILSGGHKCATRSQVCPKPWCKLPKGQTLGHSLRKKHELYQSVSSASSCWWLLMSLWWLWLLKILASSPKGPKRPQSCRWRTPLIQSPSAWCEMSLDILLIDVRWQTHCMVNSWYCSMYTAESERFHMQIYLTSPQRWHLIFCMWSWAFVTLGVQRNLGDTWGYLGIPGDTWGYLGIPGDTWGYLGIPGDTWGYLGIPENSWGYLGILGDTWGYLGIRGDTWGYLGIPGDTWGYLGIPGDIWGYLGIFGDTWGYLGIPGNIWGYLGIPGDTWGYLGIPGDIWGYLEIFGDTWGYLGIPGDIWGYLGIFGDTWGYLGIPGDIWGYLGIFGDTWKYLGIPRDTWGYLGIPGDTWGYLGIPGDTWGYLGIFGDTWGYLGILGDTWGYLGILGDTWGYLGIPGDYLGIRGDTWGYLGIPMLSDDHSPPRRWAVSLAAHLTEVHRNLASQGKPSFGGHAPHQRYCSICSCPASANIPNFHCIESKSVGTKGWYSRYRTNTQPTWPGFPLSSHSHDSCQNMWDCTKQEKLGSVLGQNRAFFWSEWWTIYIIQL